MYLRVFVCRLLFAVLFILSFNVLKRFSLSFAQFRDSFYSLDFTDFRDTAPLRDGPLEKLWEGGVGIFEPQEFFFVNKLFFTP